MSAEQPASILFGDYRAAPEGPLWSDGSCRWRVKGPGVVVKAKKGVWR